MHSPSDLNPQTLSTLMSAALKEAELAYQAGEVPVGAVILCNNEIISSGANQIETRRDATAHAEIVAIKAASQKLKNWRLGGCILCVTLEPCPMCAGAIKLARIPTVVFGAHDPRIGAFGSVYNLVEKGKNEGHPHIISGIMAKECLEILQRFFKERRKVAK